MERKLCRGNQLIFFFNFLFSLLRTWNMAMFGIFLVGVSFMIKHNIQGPNQFSVVLYLFFSSQNPLSNIFKFLWNECWFSVYWKGNFAEFFCWFFYFLFFMLSTWIRTTFLITLGPHVICSQTYYPILGQFILVLSYNCFSVLNSSLQSY